ncbi:MAG: zinc ribbon domain-containing protein [Austwickia sp.]|jgi:hypothetical protein|nr:MAG: zinc ribbon domain-containing protein [Austwickia sp.]
MPTCAHCGSDQPVEGLFCPNCGTATAALPAEPAPVALAVTDEPRVRRRGVAIAVAACVALAGVGGTAFALSRRGPERPPEAVATGATTGAAASGTTTGAAMPAAPAAATTGASTAPSTVTPAAPAPAPAAPSAPAPQPDASSGSGQWPKAQQEVQSILERDSDAVYARLDGRWVAKLASKTDGVTDMRQLSLAGTHTFGWDDVLNEHLSLRRNPNLNATILLLSSTLVGDGLVFPKTGRPYMTTIADGGFGSSDAVTAWCRRSFPSLWGDDLRNACMPMRMTRY